MAPNVLNSPELKSKDANKVKEIKLKLREFKKFIKENLKKLSDEMGFKTVYPNLKFCGDNAAMIAWAGIQRFKKNLLNEINIEAKSRWPLDENAPYMKGPGLKL